MNGATRSVLARKFGIVVMSRLSDGFASGRRELGAKHRYQGIPEDLDSRREPDREPDQ